MTDIMEELDGYFGKSVDNDNKLLTAHCCWLLSSRKTTEPSLMESADKKKDERWFSRCETFFDEAKRLASSGYSRNGFEFNGLKRELAVKVLAFDLS